MSTDVELVLDLKMDLGEAPAWDERTDELVFVDITAGAVYQFHPSSGRLSKTVVGQPVGAVVPETAGGLVLALRDGIAKLEADGSLTFIADIEHEIPGNLMNDAKCDPVGRLWAGTIAFDETEGAGNLYRVEVDGSYERVLEGTTISNGMAWSPDNALMYYIDSPTRRVDVFDYDLGTGKISNRRPFVVFGESDGLPDGMTIDAEGYIWIAFFYGGCIRRFSPEGKLDSVVELPVSQPTSCVFGGPDLLDLYITSAAVGMDEGAIAREPRAGDLFRCRPGVKGSPTVPFGRTA